MKSILIEVPRAGSKIELILPAGVTSGQAVIVTSDEVEIRLAKPAAEVAAPKVTPIKVSGEAPNQKLHVGDLDEILKRLLKLKPTKRASAVNSIKAMFQFGTPISSETAGKILEDLRKRGSLTIDTNGKIQFRKS